LQGWRQALLHRTSCLAYKSVRWMSEVCENGVRVERDSLGAVEICMDKKWKVSTQRAINNFPISGKTMPKVFIQTLALVKKCAAHTNYKLGCIEGEKCRAISSVADLIRQGEHLDQFPVDIFQTGSGTSTNMNMNEVISSLVSIEYGLQVHPNNDVNMSQSSNDVISSTISISSVLQCREQLLPAIQHLAETIDARAAEFTGVVKTGRTHLMDAVPMTLQQELSAWSAQLLFAKHAIERAMDDCLALPIGGTAIGTGLNAPPDFGEEFAVALSNTTGVPFTVAKNKFARIAAQDHIIALSAALRTLSSAFIKVCNDLRWMNSGAHSGLHEISLPAVQPGSSIMPGKVNPVILESGLMICAHVIGGDAIIASTVHSANFQLHMMLPLVAFHMLENIELLSNTCRNVADRAIHGTTANTSHLENVAKCNPILITALTPLVGYDKCAQIFHAATEQRRGLIEVAMELTDIPKERLTELLDPRKLT
jgi:fumarate hydratase class II